MKIRYSDGVDYTQPGFTLIWLMLSCGKKWLTLLPSILVFSYCHPNYLHLINETQTQQLIKQILTVIPLWIFTWRATPHVFSYQRKNTFGTLGGVWIGIWVGGYGSMSRTKWPLFGHFYVALLAFLSMFHEIESNLLPFHPNNEDIYYSSSPLPCLFFSPQLFFFPHPSTNCSFLTGSHKHLYITPQTR